MNKKQVKENLEKLEKLNQVDKIYKLDAKYVNGLYITNVSQDKSTVMRLVFTEYSLDRQEHYPKVAIAMTVEDLQNIYNTLTITLQQQRDLKRIE